MTANDREAQRIAASHDLRRALGRADREAKRQAYEANLARLAPDRADSIRAVDLAADAERKRRLALTPTERRREDRERREDARLARETRTQDRARKREFEKYMRRAGLPTGPRKRDPFAKPYGMRYTSPALTTLGLILVVGAIVAGLIHGLVNALA